MKSVGIRELRQRASDLLRLVEKGQILQVTDRGRPVALITPIRQTTSVLEELRAAGDVESATGSGIDDLPPPLLVPPGVDPASVILARLREHER